MSICSKKEALPFENGREFLCFLLAEQILFVSVQHCPHTPTSFRSKALYGAFANLLVELFLHKIPQTPVKIAIKHIYQSILYLLSV